MISVVIPSYNRKQELENCIESALSQGIDHNPEIIVVDDGSTDGTEKIIDKYPNITFIRQNHKGAAAARNNGAQKSKQEFVFFIDSDCRAEKNCAEELLKEIQKDENIAIVGCRILGKTAGFLAKCHDYAHYSNFMVRKREERKFLCSSGILVRKEYFDKMGGFNEDLKIAEEEDLGLRTNMAGYKLIYQPSAIVYHFHGRNNFQKAILHAKKWAEAGSVKPYLMHKESKYGKISSKNPYFYLFLSPIISFLVSIKIFTRIFPQDKKIILYFPFIFINKLFWCFGTFNYLKNENKRNSKI